MILNTFCTVLRKNVLSILLIVGFYPVAAQALLTSSTLTVTDSFTGFSGQTPLPANWEFVGTGSRGNTWNGTAQTSSGNGGWYGDNNVSFLGSGSASNANATWILRNSSGSPITQFTVSFKAQLFKTGSASPNVKAYYTTSSSATNPTQGTLSSALASLTFNDATANIASGTTLSQTVTNLSIANGQYIFVRLIHEGGTNSDNLGWDNISFSAVTNAPTCAKPINTGVSAITNTSASVNWQAPSGVNNYEYALTTSSTPPANGTHLAATFYSASSLNPATTYYFHLRSNCGSGSFSAWESKAFVTGGGSLQIKLMSYNLLNYPGSTAAAREPDYRIVMDAYGPDILVAQEISQAIGATSFLSNVLNYASSTYSMGTFIDGPDSDNALYYKTNAFRFISNKPVATALRDINQFSLKHNASGDTLIIFSVHLKASTGSINETARSAEIDSLRKVTDAFAPGKYFLVCGDFNFYTPEAAYQKLLATGNNTNGKFNDVITMSGSWNSAANAINHTQSPRGGSFGGMDDRFDLILFSNGIINNGGFDVVNGTYKAFGNDGQHHNQALSDPPYTQYSQALVTALTNVSDHIPVVVTLSNSNVVPVKLLRFKARKTSGMVQLNWETASELNSSTFSIERSDDHHQFTEIGTVKARGNSNNTSTYTFTDPDRKATGNQLTLYYRLKVSDRNGDTEYSEVIPVANFSNNSLLLYPNPVSDQVSIKTSDEFEQSSLAITNQLGEEITCGISKTEEGIITINTTHLKSGLYLIKMRSNDQLFTGRFIKN